MKNWKNLIGGMLLSGWILCLAPLRALAAETDSVVLELVGNDIKVTVGVGNAYEEEITGITVTLRVDVEQGEETVDFYFSDRLKDAVTGSRYQDGNLYLYVTSDAGIFDANDELFLGNVVVHAADEKQGLTARVSYAEESLETVNGAYGEKKVAPGSVSAPVAVSKSGTITPSTPEDGENTGDNNDNGTDSGNNSTTPPETKPDTTPGTTAGETAGTTGATTGTTGTATDTKPGATAGTTTGTTSGAKPGASTETTPSEGQTGVTEPAGDGSVLVRETPKPEITESETTAPAVKEPVEVHSAGKGNYKVILGIICVGVIAIVLAGGVVYQGIRRSRNNQEE